MSEVQPTENPSPTEMTSPVEAPGAPPSGARAGLRYAGLRLALVLGVGGILFAVGMRGLVWLVVTVLAASLIAAFAFRGQREAAGAELEAAMSARRTRSTEDPPHP